MRNQVKLERVRGKFPEKLPTRGHLGAEPSVRENSSEDLGTIVAKPSRGRPEVPGKGLEIAARCHEILEKERPLWIPPHFFSRRRI